MAALLNATEDEENIEQNDDEIEEIVTKKTAQSKSLLEAWLPNAAKVNVIWHIITKKANYGCDLELVGIGRIQFSY